MSAQVIGIGTDLVAIGRFARLIDRSGRRFLDRWFAPAEVDYCLSKGEPARHAAARFAAKEATLKALGLTDSGPTIWREIEVVRDAAGRPGLLLHGAARAGASRAGAHAVQISLSHDAEYATASAIAMGGPQASLTPGAAEAPQPVTAATADRPTVSVIIPVRDDPRLMVCLEAVRRQTYPAALVEVVVADNGSRTPVAESLRGLPNLRCVSEPEGGSYAARNAAVLASTGAVLAFTDADCLPEPTWLEEAVAAIAAGADIVAGHVQVYARDDRRPHPVEAYELVHAFPQETYVSRGGASVTANMCTTRAAFDAAGPFRAELASGADIEWSQRANSLGMRTVYRPSALVRHPARDSYRALRSKLERVIAGRYERDLLDGGPPVSAWPSPRSLVPPLGAFRRASSPALITTRARAAFVVGEFYHRYAGARQVLALALRTRKAARDNGRRRRHGGTS